MNKITEDVHIWYFRTFFDTFLSSTTFIAKCENLNAARTLVVMLHKPDVT